MTAGIHQIVFQKSVSRFSGHHDELVRLLSLMISKTEYGTCKFRFEVENFNESANDAPHAKVMISKPDEYRTKLYIRVQLAGRAEIFIVAMILTQEMSMKLNNVQRKLRKAANAVCDEEGVFAAQLNPCANEEQDVSVKNDDVSQGDVAGSDEQDDVSKRTIDGNDVSQDSGDVSPSALDHESSAEGEKKKRRRSAETLTETVIAQILRAWHSCNDGKSLYQREFLRIIEPMNIDLNPVLIINFLKKRKIIQVSNRVKYSPIVELTQIGTMLLRAKKKKCENDSSTVDCGVQKLSSAHTNQKTLSRGDHAIVPSIRVLRDLCAQIKLMEKEEEEKNSRIHALQRELHDLENVVKNIGLQKQELIQNACRCMSVIDVAFLDDVIRAYAVSQ